MYLAILLCIFRAVPEYTNDNTVQLFIPIFPVEPSEGEF